MRIGWSFRALAFLAAWLGVSSAWAQSPFDAQGIQRHRAYQELAPFEQVDTLSGNLMLSFIDLELPGDGGQTLRVQRVYNAKSSQFGASRWSFGLADVPMMVRFPDGGPIGAPPDPDPDFYNPTLITTDGALHRAYLSAIQPGATYRTTEFWEYRMADHRVALPNGLLCSYDAQGYLTRIEYPFGVLADVQWDSANSQTTGRALAQIVQYVGGATRTVSFSTDADSWPLPRTMSFEGRQWTYDVRRNPFAVTAVHLPDGGTWSFDYAPDLTLASVVTPNGGQTLYNFVSHAFRNSPENGTPVYSTVLAHREVVARANRDLGGTWSYAYPGPTNDARITIVSGPMSIRKAYFYEQLPFSGVGEALTRIQTWDDGGQSPVLAEDETRQYDVRTVALNAALPVVTRRTVSRDGRLYETSFAYATGNGDYGQPYLITEIGDFSRTTFRVFETGFRTPFGSSAYLPSLVREERLTVGGETFTKAYTYESGTGFLSGQNIYSIQHTFEHGARGNVTAEIDGVGLRTTHTYTWGVRANTQTPEYLIERVINSDSTVAWERRNGHTTSYQYDGLFRRTLVTPPEGFATSTTFDPAGQWVRVRRGSGSSFAETTYTLDGLGRAIAERNTVGVNKRYAYDVLGRRTDESLPYYDGATSLGTSWYYDALGRVTFETYADGREKRFQYANGDVRIFDEEDRQTLQDWAASGDPDNRRLAAVTDANGSQFVYSYNGLDKLTRVGQPGNTARTWTYTPGTELLVSETHPELGTTTYLNDAAGRMRRLTDPSGRGFEHHYDGNNRLTQIDGSGPDEFDTYFAYDADDNRTSARNGVVTSTFTYDAANRLRQREDKFPAIAAPFRTTYTYTGLDAIDTLTYPSNTTIDYGYDREGRLTSVSRLGGGLLMEVLQHHPSGAFAHTRFGNGLEEHRTYDTRHRPDAVNLPDLALDYDYTDAGNVQRIRDTRAGYTQDFVYDAVDRLTSYHRGVTTIVYGYDRLGNRTTAGGATYTYDPVTLRPNQLTHGIRGQVQNDGQGQYTYTPTIYAMLATAIVNGVTTSYRYDADDLRKITVPPSGSHEYVIHGQGTQVLTEAAVTGANAQWTRDYVYAGSQLVAALRPAPPVRLGLRPGSVFQRVIEGQPAYLQSEVTMDGPAGQVTPAAMTVSWEIRPGTATTADYVGPATGSVVVPQGTPVPHPIEAPFPTIQDSLDEPDERYTVHLSVDPWVSLGASVATIEIADDDPPPGARPTVGFVSAGQQVSEAAGGATVSLVVTTPTGAPTTAPIVVNVATQNGSAVAGADYGTVQGPVTIAAGQQSGVPFGAPIPIVNDSAAEPTEQFAVTLTVGPDAVPGIVAHTVTILDDDVITVTFEPAAQTVSEAAGGVPVTVWVRTGNGQPTPRAFTLAFGTYQSTATENLDYGGAAGSFVVNAGTPHNTPYTAVLPILNDVMDEPDEIFGLVIWSPDNGAVTGPPLPITIQDDDAPGASIQVDLVGAQQSIGEAAGAVPVSVRVTTANGGPTPVGIQLTFATVQGTATPNVDYGHAVGSVPVAALTPSGTLISSALAIVNDGVDEPHETFRLDISASLPGASAVPSQTITIIDDDPGAFGLMATPPGESSATMETGGTAKRPAPSPPRPIGEWRTEAPPVRAPAPLTWTVRPTGGADANPRPKGEQ